jgi:tRNA G10  N-methylase Trm11
MEELRSHPTAKPVALIADAMRDCTRRGDVVLDAFSGSGTTIMAAERIGRRAYVMEIEPRYVDVAIRRWQAFTRKDAVHADTGATFDQLAAERPIVPGEPGGRTAAQRKSRSKRQSREKYGEKMPPPSSNEQLTRSAPTKRTPRGPKRA